MNPVIHLRSFASTLTLLTPGGTLTKISGDDNFITISANQVQGITIDGVDPNDSNGTVMLEGVFSTFDFNLVWNTCNLPGATSSGPCPSGIDDGISLQLGATPAVIPNPAAVWLFGSALGLLGWRQRKAA